MKESDFENYALTSYDPVEIIVPEIQATDEEVDRELRRLATLHATYQDIESHPINADDCICVAIETFEGDRLLPGMTHENIDLQLGIGTMPAEFEIGLLGHSAGETVTIEYEAPHMGPCMDKKPTDTHLRSNVKVLSLRKIVIPEITDEWVDRNVALSTNVADARKRIAQRMIEKKRMDYARTVSNKIATRIGKRLKEPISQKTVVKVARQLRTEFEHFLVDYEIGISEYLESQNLDEQSFQTQLEDDARQRISEDIALMLYARKQGVSIEDKDIDAAFGQPTPEKTYEARKQAEQSGTIAQMHDVALRKKAAAIATRQAVYRNKQGVIDVSFKTAVEDVLLRQEKIDCFTSSDPMKAKLNGCPAMQ